MIKMEDKIRQYIQRGSKHFNITRTDTLRDGGTVMVRTNLGEYYLDKLSYSLHNSYPTNFENMVDDEPFFWFFMSRMERYLEHLNVEAKQMERIINHHKTI